MSAVDYWHWIEQRTRSVRRRADTDESQPLRPLAAGPLEVHEHSTASTTTVRKIREAIGRHHRGE